MCPLIHTSWYSYYGVVCVVCLIENCSRIIATFEGKNNDKVMLPLNRCCISDLEFIRIIPLNIPVLMSKEHLFDIAAFRLALGRVKSDIDMEWTMFYESKVRMLILWSFFLFVKVALLQLACWLSCTQYTWHTVPGTQYLAHSTWHTVPGTQYLAHSTPGTQYTWHTVPGTQYLAHSTWHTVPGTQYTWHTVHLAHSTRHTVPGTQYTWHTVHLAHSTPGTQYLAHSTWHTVPGTQYLAHRTWHTVPGTQYTWHTVHLAHSTRHTVPGTQYTWHTVPGTQYLFNWEYDTVSMRAWLQSSLIFFTKYNVCLADNMFVVTSKFALFDAPLVFFTAASIFSFLKFHKHADR